MRCSAIRIKRIAQRTVTLERSRCGRTKQSPSTRRVPFDNSRCAGQFVIEIAQHGDLPVRGVYDTFDPFLVGAFDWWRNGNAEHLKHSDNGTCVA